MKPIGILYEHPEWFTPLFAELEKRGLPYARIPAHRHVFDPDSPAVPYSLVVNRVSPSSYLRGHTAAIFYARHYLAHLEQAGVPMVNGPSAYALELSKAKQLSLLAKLGARHPHSRVINSPEMIEPAASELRYPVIVKPNIGGSGALMTRFSTPEELGDAVRGGQLDALFGLDNTAIVQEYHPPKSGSIVRVEALDGAFLYAIRIYNDPDQGFNLCPADICMVESRPAESAPGEVSGAAAASAPVKKPLRIEVASPPAWVVDTVLGIFREGGLDVGGVEYLESERDGQIYFYDVNALSNFVTDAPALVGFDPFVRFVDYLERRTSQAGEYPSYAAPAASGPSPELS